LGFITSIGNTRAEVLESLRTQKTGISFLPELETSGSTVRLAGAVKGFDVSEMRQEDWELPGGYEIPREYLRSMSPNAVYGWCAMEQAIADAGLSGADVSNPKTGLLAASGGSMRFTYQYLKTMHERGVTRVHPLGMPAAIAGTLNMNLVAGFRIKGASLGVSTACASSAHAFGHALDQIRLGRQDLMFVAGGEDCDYWSIVPFAGLRALTTKTDPTLSPCAFDARRDGFAVAGGACVLVLEEKERAMQRGAKIYAEALGWGEASDGFSVVAPEPHGEGLGRAMENALLDAEIGKDAVDYINAHATSTLAGDLAELRALKRVFSGAKVPAVSSTKSLTGHGLSLAGAMEAAFCCLALKEGFFPVSANIRELDPECEGVDVIAAPRDGAPEVVLSNSSGFGGSNVVVALGVSK